MEPEEQDPFLRSLGQIPIAFRTSAIATGIFALVVTTVVVIVFWLRANDLERIAEGNAALNEKQDVALSYLCETIHILDAYYIQSAEIDQRLAQQPDLPDEIVALLRQRRAYALLIHTELSDTRPCREIE